MLSGGQKYLVNAVRLHSKLPSKALGGIDLGTVFRQLALVVMTHRRLSGNTRRAMREHLRRGGVRERNTASGLKW